MKRREEGGKVPAFIPNSNPSKMTMFYAFSTVSFYLNKEGKKIPSSAASPGPRRPLFLICFLSSISNFPKDLSVSPFLILSECKFRVYFRLLMQGPMEKIRGASASLSNSNSSIPPLFVHWISSTSAVLQKTWCVGIKGFFFIAEKEKISKDDGTQNWTYIFCLFPWTKKRWGFICMPEGHNCWCLPIGLKFEA